MNADIVQVAQRGEPAKELVPVWRINTASLFYHLLSLLPEKDAFLDVGSLDGREAFAVEERFPKVAPIAFEPNPRNIAVIEDEQQKRHSRIMLETYAIGNENSTVSFYTRNPRESDNFGASSILKFSETDHDTQFDTTRIEVPLRRLDTLELLAPYTHLALWIDVEGAGYQVLEGIAAIAQKVQLVHIEVETRQLFEGQRLANDIITLMRGYGMLLVGSNLDAQMRKAQGDLVFLREDVLDTRVVKQATTQAWLIEHIAMQRFLRKVVPLSLYQKGRNWFVRTIAAR